MRNDKKALRLFLIIVFAVSAVVEAVWIILGEEAAQSGISTLLMMVPFIVAIVIGRTFYTKQGSLGFSRCRFIYILSAVIIPLLYLALSYGLFWLVVKGSYTGNPSVLLETAAMYSGRELPANSAIIISFIIMIPVSILTALGEEAGWRGFMYPVLQRLYGWKKAIAISGGVWALWHLPIVIAGVYYPPQITLIYVIPIFLIEIFALTVIITWLRIAAKSVWPAIVFHAAHNFFDQIVFQSLTESENSIYFVGEIGFITLAITILIAVVILVRGRKVFTAYSSAV